jgi:molybdopterin-guanine dinucleotide biosynthesis protein A
MPTDVLGIVLTGGQSRRMGRDKAALPWRGRRLVDHVAGCLRQAGVDGIRVSGQTAGYDCIADRCANAGPVAGLSAVIEHCYLPEQPVRLVFVPVDLPWLCPDALKPLVQATGAVFWQGHPLPCALTLDRPLWEQATSWHRRMQNGERFSVQQCLARLNARALVPNAAMGRALFNTNTPRQWQEATDATQMPT